HAPLGCDVAQLPGLLAVHALDLRELAPELPVELVVEAELHEQDDTRGEYAHDQRQHERVPRRQARAHAERQRPHACRVPSTKPTPRTVCRSLRSKGSSILRRSRAMVTSMTLSSGVARAFTCQTSEASISRETTRPGWRSRYSRISNS